jgi:hypothetical protein
MIYFAIRVAIASAIMIGFYVTRGFASKLDTFVMAFAAALASQAVAFGVKMIAGKEPRTTRSIGLLAASCAVAIGAISYVLAS